MRKSVLTLWRPFSRFASLGFLPSSTLTSLYLRINSQQPSAAVKFIESFMTVSQRLRFLNLYISKHNYCSPYLAINGPLGSDGGYWKPNVSISFQLPCQHLNVVNSGFSLHIAVTYGRKRTADSCSVHRGTVSAGEREKRARGVGMGGRARSCVEEWRAETC